MRCGPNRVRQERAGRLSWAVRWESSTLERFVTIVLLLVAIPVAGLAFALLLGAGVLRQAAPALVSATAVALVFLPAMGIAALSGNRVQGLLVGTPVWAALVLLGFPLYFPGERDEALAAGIGVMAGVFGIHPDPTWALALDGLLPEVGGSRAVPPPAERPVAALAARALDGDAALAAASPSNTEAVDEVVLPYEGTGRTLSVPVVLEGPAGRSSDVWMLFDTGATLTTVDRATLDELHVTVSPDSPELTVRTASGERRTRLAMLERVWVGGFLVDGVTISVCDECADDETVGLLGLNVSGRFLVTVDQSRHELVLRPRTDGSERTLDIAPWMQVSATATRWEDGRIEVEVRAESQVDREVTEAEVEIRCNETWLARLRQIPPRGTAKTVVALPLGADCTDYSVALTHASW